MNNVMIDLEALGQEPGSVILTLTAVQFDIETGQTGKIFEESIDLKSCMDIGLTIDPITIMWWMIQSEEARRKLKESQDNPDSISDVLSRFGVWLNHLPHTTLRILYNREDINIWGRGPRFDMGLLSYAYKVLGYKTTPWNFRNERCVRTYESIRPDMKNNTPFEGILHNGIDDAKHEIKYVCKIHQFIEKMKSLDITLTNLK
jgi:hypothetical protein